MRKTNAPIQSSLADAQEILQKVYRVYGSSAPKETSVSTKMVIEVYTYDCGEMSGILRNALFGGFFPFSSAMGLVKLMESLYDELAFPQSAVNYRSFFTRSRKQQKKEPISMASREEQNEKKTLGSGIAKFIVHVQFRQNATWQGTIQWVDEDRVQHFRSTLEMLKLIDEALDASEAKKQLRLE